MERIKAVAFIGNYLPRMCGIATFTTDLVNAVSKATDGIDCWTVAMNDRMEGYRYPEKVRFEINQSKLSEYELASDFLNISQVDVVSLQHEYGIFGGDSGNYILSLLKGLRIPVVTTLHTVLKEPTADQRKVLAEIASLSSRVVVMAEKAKSFLTDIYRIPAEKVSFIHHGIPDLPFVDPNYYKDQFGVEGKKVILTFGLLSPNKGIEYMIDALPSVVRKHPEAVYIVVGSTHPHVKKSHGEEYRQGLERLARTRGVGKNIMFFDRFVDKKELCEFLGACDVYVTPYLGEAQIVSGTLAYAMGVGAATVSTPYWYAREMLAEDRGILVDFKDSKSIADAVIKLLDDDALRNSIRKNAYGFTRKAVWSHVAIDYVTVFNEVKIERERNPRMGFETKTLEKEKSSIPEINLSHLRALTDDTGIIQHAAYSVPDYYHGYCVDDNARALIATVMAQQLLLDEADLLPMQKKYLAFVYHAYDERSGWFRNFMDYRRNWLEDKGSEDSQGRAIWSLGVSSALSREEGCLALSTTLFHRSFRMLEELRSPRAIAFALVGIHAYLSRFSGDSEVRRLREKLALKLFGFFPEKTGEKWPWMEDMLAYDNAKVPQALLLSGQWMQREDISELGFKVLNWLIDIQKESGRFSSIGNRGWHRRGEASKARFDQQPIEAQSMLETCLLAYRMTGNEYYQETAVMVFNWFLGQNDLNVPLYDYATGGCRDGLTPDGANKNQGAESTVAWLISLLSMHGFKAEQERLQYVKPFEES